MDPNALTRHERYLITEAMMQRGIEWRSLAKHGGDPGDPAWTLCFEYFDVAATLAAGVSREWVSCVTSHRSEAVRIYNEQKGTQ